MYYNPDTGKMALNEGERDEIIALVVQLRNTLRPFILQDEDQDVGERLGKAFCATTIMATTMETISRDAGVPGDVVEATSVMGIDIGHKFARGMAEKLEAGGGK